MPVWVDDGDTCWYGGSSVSFWSLSYIDGVSLDWRICHCWSVSWEGFSSGKGDVSVDGVVSLGLVEELPPVEDDGLLVSCFAFSRAIFFT